MGTRTQKLIEQALSDPETFTMSTLGTTCHWQAFATEGYITVQVNIWGNKYNIEKTLTMFWEGAERITRSAAERTLMHFAPKHAAKHITTKQLKTITTVFGDGKEIMERFAVLNNGVRIGTVHKFTGHSGPTYYDALRGTEGKRGDGLILKKDRYEIERFYDFDKAVQAI